ncbi:hypothetical protein [Candidatus Enterococcus ferrettii]|uniref:Lipoprotein n=1 Tax=Candidatus Enterococcus ferrettii TaxID=2815324 RepID=A0ABV0EHX7_9ENTE|nr:hypothetical protein [Enterococcus sp. 665A]
MKKIKGLLVAFLAVFFLAACGSSEPDYTTEQAEAALNAGEDIEGKTVSITVDKLVPNSAFGYNIQTGEHLNFVSENNPKVDNGDSLIVKVSNVKSVAGSFVIEYTEVSKPKTSNSKKNESSSSSENVSESTFEFDSTLYVDNTSLKDLMRDPEIYKGAKQSFVAKVFQVSTDEDEGITQYLATVTPSPDESVTIALLIKNKELETKILEDDELRVWVRYIKPLEYETVSGSTNEVPAFYLDHYNIINE